MSPIGYDKAGWPVLYPNGAQIPLNLPRSSKSHRTRRVELSADASSGSACLTTSEACAVLGLSVEKGEPLLRARDLPRRVGWDRQAVEGLAAERQR